MKKNKLWLLLLLSALLVVLAACGGSDDKGKETGGDTTNNDNNNDKQETVTGGHLILEVLSEAVELDPHGSNDVPSSNVQNNIYETLVVRNFDTGEIEPQLAESWEQIDDVTVQLKLRQDVKFHDGTPFNAEAVKINLDRLLDPAVASPRATNFEPIESVTVVDEYTVEIKTKTPYGPIMAVLTHSGGYMISPTVIAKDYEEAGDDTSKLRAYVNANPVGTGFLKFDAWTPGQEIRLVKNTEYWGEQVAYDSAVFKTVPESATRAADLEVGNAHIIDPVQPTEVSMVEGFATVNEQPSMSIAYIGFNAEKAPFDNPKVRQAISKAIDREEILQGVYDGFGVAAKGPLSPMIWGQSDDIVPQDYNIEEAKALLAEAGYPDGFKTEIWTNDNPQRQQIAIVLQEKLKQLNIEVKIEVMEWGAYLEKTGAGDHQMFILGWSASTGDADGALYPLFHSSDIGNNNRTRFSNPEVDKLLAAARIETDSDTRLGYYKEAQTLLNAEAPAAFIHHQAYLTGVSKKVTGFTIDPTGIYKIQHVKFVE
ncbi:glutathione ABC transporter substrate-binding protein [Metasolibacillus meyeri]|uniref:Glutathione ABC transporter substrate-binding protein n=1 Tax=Metasolibacillus meyeri TaxID=1071052 RepID=A0AAW9NH25_9BACL|nr:glutathione ABC transporter substrate-binding protein [Metasolibacillus meyeri]MEC1177934.1 glutathione ABC transporter substrate-binding protein [Metasolibacillus meyeri]